MKKLAVPWNQTLNTSPGTLLGVTCHKSIRLSFKRLTCISNISKFPKSIVFFITMRFPAKTKTLEYGICKVAKMLEEEMQCKVSSNKYMNKDNQELKNLQTMPFGQKCWSSDLKWILNIFLINPIFNECFLSFSNHLGKSLQLLMDRVDEMSQDIVKYNTYLRNVSKQQQQKHQVGNMENLNERIFFPQNMVWVVLSKTDTFGSKQDKILTQTYPLSRYMKCASQWGIIKWIHFCWHVVCIGLSLLLYMFVSDLW